MPKERLTIGSTARLHPDEVARHTFGSTRRGFDPAEVRAFLEDVAREMAASADREQELRRAVAEADHRAANPVLDEGTLTAALGQETARVLRSAHDAAAELLARAEGDAARLRAQAQEEAEQLERRSQQGAGDRVAQAEAAAAELRRRAEDEAGARVESARLEAETLDNQARAECRAMVREAQELRARVLADLTRRRRVLHSQIEQLRAGRERLAETIGDVRNAVDHITDELFRAEDEARMAAEAAGRQAAQEVLAEPAPTPDAARATGGGEPGGAPEGPEPEPDPARRQSVEELFARLRAEADGPRPGEAAAVPEPAGAPAGSAEPDPGAVRGVTSGPDAEGPGAVGGDQDGGGAGEPGAGGGVLDGAGQPDPVIARRDEILVPLVATLARRLKRALQDDQNDILDRLRAKGGWAPTVMPTEEEHAERYVQASFDQLVEAARAGVDFVGGGPDDAPGVHDVAAGLASAIVGPLRRRLDGAGPAVEVGDEGALVELVGAAFREWKGARVERLAGDQAVLAFSRAALAGVPAGSSLRWVVDDDGAECPDCDDNALAGAVPAGDEFPTGHAHPPAHAGCRCLLAPANA